MRSDLQRQWSRHFGRFQKHFLGSDLSQFVRRTQLQTVYEVRDGVKVHGFSEQQLDQRGNPLGLKNARRAAEALYYNLKALGRDVTIKSRQIPQIDLCVQTDSGQLYRVDAETGRDHWSRSVGRERRTYVPAVGNEQYIAAINGSQLTLLETATGQVVWQRNMQGIPATMPVFAPRHVCVLCTNGGLECYALDDQSASMKTMFSYGDVTAKPVVTPASICWPTRLGLLYGASPTADGFYYRVEVRDPVWGSAAYQAPNRIFFVTERGDVLAIHDGRGDLIWKLPTGHSVRQSPVVIDKTLYVSTEFGGLYSVDSASGSVRWNTGGVRQFVAANEHHVYALTSTGQLAKLAAQSGEVLQRIQLPRQSFVPVNYLSDRIFVISPSGGMECWREPNYHWPMLHDPLPPPEDPARKKQDNGSKSKPSSLENDPADSRPSDTEPAASGDKSENPNAVDDPVFVE